jgi:hypothetical protein
MSCDRPTRAQNPVTVHSYNSIAYYAGKAEWNPINLTLRDDVTNSIAKLIGHQEQKQMNHFEQTTALAGSNYKFEMYVESMDGGNDNILCQWYLEGCFLDTVNSDGYDYSSAEPMTFQLSIRYDNATMSGGLMPTTPALLTGVGI